MSEQNQGTRQVIFVVLVFGLIILALVTLLYLTNDYQYNRFKPDVDNMSCEELGNWIIDKRINGNGYENMFAKQYADIYPIKCGDKLP